MDKEKMIDIRTVAFQCATNIITMNAINDTPYCIYDVMLEAEEIVEYILSGRINCENKNDNLN